MLYFLQNLVLTLLFYFLPIILQGGKYIPSSPYYRPSFGLMAGRPT
jgi:hypothetical protein